MTIDWSKAPEGTTGAMVAQWEHPRGEGYVEFLPSAGGRSTFSNSWKYVPRPVSWNGEGLPPVGTVCDVHHETWADGLWEIRKVLWIGKTNVVTETASGTELNGLLGKLEFRPIRTAEQIAAEERGKGISEMIDIYKSNYEGLVADGCQALYDAGYRKQELTQ